MSTAAGSSGPPPPGGNGSGRNSKDNTPKKPGSNPSTPKKSGTPFKGRSTPGSPTPASQTSTPGSRSNAPGSNTSTPSKKWGDGRSKQTAQWSETLRQNPSQQPQFVIDRKVASPRWVRESLANARQLIGIGYDFYHGASLERINESNIPGAPGAGGPSNPNTPFYHQQAEILRAEGELEEAGEQVGHDEDLEEGDEHDEGEPQLCSCSLTVEY
jgi:hypothetical protein